MVGGANNSAFAAKVSHQNNLALPNNQQAKPFILSDNYQ
jgi:hypothetical protein